MKKSEMYDRTSYSKEALKHFKRMKDAMQERGLRLGLVDYRAAMGYPPLQRKNNVKPLPQAQVDRVERYLLNRKAPKITKKVIFKGKSKTTVRT